MWPYLNNLGDKPRDWLQLHLGNVVTQSVSEAVIVWFGEGDSREEVRGDTSKEWQVMGQKLGQVNIIDGPQKKDTLTLFWILQLEITSSCQD